MDAYRGGKVLLGPSSVERETPSPVCRSVFYEGSTRYGETWLTDGRGNISLLNSQGGFPQTTDILSGNFGCLAWTQDNGPQEWTNLLFYNRASQSGTIFARGDVWLPIRISFPCPPVPSGIWEGAPLQGTRPFPPRPWSIFVTGNFWMPDVEDSYFGTSGRYPNTIPL